ncbi:hypothetical protein ACFP81_02060 [Deinococcus lacus]|uniref:Uncharacterized protein n=1 Tax=Deinococcus lacus TaxID=392561 RepID=A0ABW1Y9Q9_9DEIO
MAEVTYVQGDEMAGMRQLWVGKMHGLPSDEAVQHFGRAAAQDYQQWAASPAYAAWVKQQPPAPRFGFSQDCRVFIQQPLPAGITSCTQGPGPADGPAITVRLANGQILNFDIPSF